MTLAGRASLKIINSSCKIRWFSSFICNECNSDSFYFVQASKPFPKAVIVSNVEVTDRQRQNAPQKVSCSMTITSFRVAMLILPMLLL